MASKGARQGQARVLTLEEQRHVFNVIDEHRHPEKNLAIMLVSFRLALRVQEISLLEIGDVAKLLHDGTEFRLKDVLVLPASYTKGANARSNSYERSKKRRLSFTVDEFDRVVDQITALATAGAEVTPSMFYPDIKEHRGKSRDLPMVDPELRDALSTYISLRIQKESKVYPTDPLFKSQKGGSYNANTLQEHMSLILQSWAGLDRATSHSGRRTVITDMIHRQGKSIKVAQLIAGHKYPATTIIYDQPPEAVVKEALSGLTRLTEVKG